MQALLAHQFVIFSMGANPKPMYATWHGKTQCAVVEVNPSTVKFVITKCLEKQRGVIWISLEQSEITMRKGLSLSRQSVKALPKAL
jgi:hypothetical protein